MDDYPEDADVGDVRPKCPSPADGALMRDRGAPGTVELHRACRRRRWHREWATPENAKRKFQHLVRLVNEYARGHRGIFAAGDRAPLPDRTPAAQ